ncbi:MAG: tRNA (adenosine(37)-N6)-dimethylallyltransferase MiaA, partial [Actinobacteria bacterium]|nr:tRNA (adenosine(37)-N6)-dimethylallyltransferase MiaA [Actinomycetota bacterium]NIT94028.1 tRNA (adenosine(37)-N6)-dimethylallyltransferase MiaA [Actinomycetota bacterium]NIU17657.1 tRNA (adenosine(37)-N6)-dimethylallyltransferase MiaA [Actinomycetota bacterium]NIV54165.1 tRNA (adenosine(37)-N6)-dimethylallyltransferase MiaA [Actinomycetota bacterium]NIX49013.1 tRNA (adenosine(37)-N6)-dimethylallyltransferase MiaA [Actinomycetota bacterium]
MLGPTASGKSEVALRLAETLGAEIISVDSMQVYRRMDIGTAKPSLAERARVVHHGLDLVDPADEYSVSDFQQMGRRIIESSEVPLVIAGGSGLHFRALVDPMRFRPRDPGVRARVERLTLSEAVARLLVDDPEAEAHVD